MEISIRKIGFRNDYREMKLKYDHVQIDMGHMDEVESIDVAVNLISAASDLLPESMQDLAEKLDDIVNSIPR